MIAADVTSCLASLDHLLKRITSEPVSIEFMLESIETGHFNQSPRFQQNRC
jgi:hypothetical protein